MLATSHCPPKLSTTACPIGNEAANCYNCLACPDSLDWVCFIGQADYTPTACALRMEDPTNRPTSDRDAPSLPGDALVAVSAPAAQFEAPSSPAKPPRRIDDGSWLAACAAAQPWLPHTRIAAGKTSPLLWGTGDRLTAEAVDLQTKLHRATVAQRWKNELAPALDQFLSEVGTAEGASPAAALEALAWGYLLPTIARQDKSETAPRTLQQLLTLVDAPPLSASPLNALTQLSLQVELPLLLACFAPDPKSANSLRKGALGAEARLAAAWLDPFALPKQELATVLRAWLATMVRAQELLRNSETQFSDSARERIERLARHVLRLSRPDGSSILRTAAGSASDREFLTAVVLATDSTPAIAALALGKGTADAKPIKGMPAAPLYSPKSLLAVLRNRWAAPQTQTTVDFSGTQVWLDLSCGNRSLLHGAWDVAVNVNGRPATPLGPWTEVCWHSDADCDYLEIEQKLSGGWLLQRHVLLTRRDECLLLADSLLNETKLTPIEFTASAASAPRLEYATSLQLSPEIAFVPQQESREGHLISGRKPLALVMPLALPEWRKQLVAGELISHDGRLQHSLRAQGRNLFAPLWLDLNPGRFKNQTTWRQLTVGESLIVQPREVAVGYRVQVHYSQWLLYRSLAWRGNRTVLGKNFATDLACCRFQPNGETQEILEVQ